MLKDSKIRDISKPETLEKRFRGKICADGLHVLKALLEIDPDKRPSIDEVISHTYFDDIRKKQERSLSPRPVHEKRVHSSTYRSNKYSNLEGDDDVENKKRHPSHSNERNTQIRTTGIFGTQDQRVLDNTSQLSNNPSDVNVDRKKSFNSTKTGGFLIKDQQLTQRKEGSSYGKKEEKESSRHEHIDNKHNIGNVSTKRRMIDPKKSSSNFRMFRIRII